MGPSRSQISQLIVVVEVKGIRHPTLGDYIWQELCIDSHLPRRCFWSNYWIIILLGYSLNPWVVYQVDFYMSGSRCSSLLGIKLYAEAFNVYALQTVLGGQRSLSTCIYFNCRKARTSGTWILKMDVHNSFCNIFWLTILRRLDLEFIEALLNLNLLFIILCSL